ncbi:hypothetical protein LC653_37930 [Nostoc sp. CHAB 5784]|uniref:hypothetical protein n=1 Tax=Nostoc mirabile TaxID=2907820 RepID=UPI001E5FCCBC|nr:hypothetical protein [Nostoc mirabile]MCC5669463.1 hypothetical protein [Nostoc mirabile CHAB5784]
MADKILRDACKRIGVEGVSTHSFRRTARAQMSSAGIPPLNYSRNFWTQRPLDFAALSGGHARAKASGCFGDWVLVLVCSKVGI